MKTSEISVGDIYGNGAGLREVVGISNSEQGPLVTYRILAARSEKEFSPKAGEMVSIIGTLASSLVSSLASWAKERYSPEQGQQKCLELQAARIKLSVGELAFLRGVLEEVDGHIELQMSVSIDHTEGRAVSGLNRKGLVTRNGNEAQLTPLGTTWLLLEKNRMGTQS